MRDSQIFPFCRKNGIRLPQAWRHSCNAVRPHDSRETDKHWDYKQQIFRELFKRKQTVFTEIQFDYSNSNSGSRMSFPCADIMWLDSLIIIELESKLTRETMILKLKQFKDFNCFVFDIQKDSVDDILEKIGFKKPPKSNL